jgi:hypothetical protein
MKSDDGPNEVERLIRDFLDGKQTPEELRDGLCGYALRPDIGLHAFTSVNIDWQQLPQERLFAYFEVTSKIIGPTLESFFAGQLSVDDAAVQVAPFLLLGGGFGFEPPPDVDPKWHERSEALTEKVAKLHTENRR